MNVLSFLSILAAAFFAFLAGKVALGGLGLPLNRRFFVPVALLAGFSLSQAFFFDAPDARAAWPWHVAGSACWGGVVAFHLWLVLGLCLPRPPSPGWLLPILLPAAVLVGRIATFPPGESIGIVQTPAGWARDFSAVPLWGGAVALAVAAYAVPALVVLAWWWRRAPLRRQRRQAAWILGGGLATTLLNVAAATWHPLHLAPVHPHVPHLLATFWVVGYAVAIRRHRLMAVTPSQAAEAILGGMQDLVLLLDGAGRILQASERSMGLLGIPPHELVGRGVDTLARDPGPVRAAVKEFRGRAAPGRGIEAVLATREGGEVPVLLSGSAVADRDGDPIGVALVVQDQRPMRELLKNERIESIGMLAGGIAHDFNNLLTAISGFVNLARMDAGDPESVRRRLAEASRACDRAQGLTRQLLTFSRGGAPILRATSLAEVARESASFVGAGSSARIEVDTAPGLWLAEADAGQMGQVVHNLVLNAVQAMPGGGVVRLRASNVPAGQPGVDGAPQPEDRVRLEVADEGVGIPAERLSRIFEPFFTTKPDGNGLGLAAVHSIVRRHGGGIAIESRVGRGTTVRIDLPRSRRASPQVPAASPDVRPSSGRVLLMDDQPGVLQVADEMLRRIGCQVTPCADGESAVRVHRQALQEGRPFDLALLDLTMPGGPGGIEVLQRLRQAQPGLKAIVSSGYAADAVMADYRNRGFDAVLPKPYDLPRLKEVLDALLPQP